MTVQANTPDEIRRLKAHEKRERKNAWRQMQKVRTKFGMFGIRLVSPRGARALSPKMKAMLEHHAVGA